MWDLVALAGHPFGPRYHQTISIFWSRDYHCLNWAMGCKNFHTTVGSLTVAPKQLVS